jgi:hypothetical protein
MPASFFEQIGIAIGLYNSTKGPAKKVAKVFTNKLEKLARDFDNKIKILQLEDIIKEAINKKIINEKRFYDALYCVVYEKLPEKYDTELKDWFIKFHTEYILEENLFLEENRNKYLVFGDDLFRDYVR